MNPIPTPSPRVQQIRKDRLANACKALWKDPAVRAKRIARIKCQDTKSLIIYSSIMSACKKLGLSLSYVTENRQKLKQGVLVEHEGHTFRGVKPE